MRIFASEKIKYWAGIILLAYLSLGILFGLVVPPFENLDEIEHLEVVRYVAETGRLPVHGAADSEHYHYRQEASQPPLYYILSAGLVRLLGLQAEDGAESLRLNPWVACGPGAAHPYDNRAVFYHNPNQEAFPWQGVFLMLHGLRIWSTLLQAVTVLGTYLLARRAFPDRGEVAVVGMAVVAFNPQFLLVASGVNNDNLVTPLVTLALYLLLRIWQEGASTRRAVGLGVLTGLAGLSKLSGWFLLVLTSVTLLALALRSRTRARLVICHLSSVILPALAIGSWWFWRNWQLYGDPTALRPMLALVGSQGTPFHFLSSLGLMFRSFWGQIPCAFYPEAFYDFYIVLAVLAVGGLVWKGHRWPHKERWVVAILAGWLLLILVSWMRWDAMTPAPGGRLLFPALPAVSLLMALGISGVMSGRLRVGNWVVVGLLAGLALWVGGGILPAFFAPPPRTDDPSIVPPEAALEGSFGETIRLLGVETALDEQTLTLDVTLYWQAIASMTEDYVMALQLVSPVVGDSTLRWNYNSWPGHGNYPTSAWQPGEVIADRYRFPLPEAEFPTQAWELHLALYREADGERLPAWVGEVPVGDRLLLTYLRVPGVPPTCPEAARLDSQVRLGDAVVLSHAWVTQEQEATQVALCWETLQPLNMDYNVLIHLYDEFGVLISAGDGPPMQGAFPTLMWRPGDIALDAHLLEALVSSDGGQTIAVGMYNLADGVRLPVFVDGVALPDAAVEIWPDRP